MYVHVHEDMIEFDAYTKSTGKPRPFIEFENGARKKIVGHSKLVMFIFSEVKVNVSVP